LVFPVEAEHKAKRRALNLCQEHLRKVMNIYRKMVQLIDACLENDSLATQQLYKEVQEIGEEIDNSKRVVAQELVEIGTILISREDFLRFTDVTSEIADLCKGIAYRIFQMVDRKWNVPHNIIKGIVELAGVVSDAAAMLRETFLMLNYGSPKVLEKAKEVEIAERKVDDKYRFLEIILLESKLEINILLLARDIIQLLEDVADKIEDASDATRILAFAL